MTALEEFLSKLDSKIAKQVVLAREVETNLLPTASYSLNDALGGGIGRGRVTLIYGPTSSGKSALVQQSLGQWQKDGNVVAYVDTERTWDNDWTEKLGVDNDELILVQQRSISKIYNSIKPFLESGIDVVVIDSISMALPDVFLDSDGRAKNLEDHRQIGAKAKALTALVNAIHYSNEDTAVILISQTTTEIGQTYTKQIPDGGKKVQFASSQIVKLTSSNIDSKQIKRDIKIGDRIIKVPVGRKVEATVEKNKIASPGRTGEYDFYYSGPHVGIDSISEIVREAVVLGVIKKSSSWYNYRDYKWQGKSPVIEALREDDDLCQEIISKNDEVKNE